jgi:hypothetical protein
VEYITMSAIASGSLMPSGVITRALGLMRLEQVRMIAGQVSKIRTGHRLSATVCTRRPGGYRYRKKAGCKYLQHASLLTAKPQGQLIVPAATKLISSSDSATINGPTCQAPQVP